VEPGLRVEGSEFRDEGLQGYLAHETRVPP